MVGQRDLSWSRRTPTADQGGRADRMVRGPERSLADEPALRQPHRGIDLGRLDRFISLERRQDGWDTPRQHGLPDAGSSHHEKVVSSCHRDLERDARRRLAAHVTQDDLRVVRARRIGSGRGTRQLVAALHGSDDVFQVIGREHFDALDVARLEGRRCGEHDAAHPEVLGEESCGEGAADGSQRSVESELAEEEQPRQSLFIDHLLGSEQRERDR